jgi:salicylate hydroxylase
LGHKIKCFVVPWFLWFTSGKREKHFAEDVTTSDLGF